MVVYNALCGSLRMLEINCWHFPVERWLIEFWDFELIFRKRQVNNSSPDFDFLISRIQFFPWAVFFLLRVRCMRRNRCLAFAPRLSDDIGMGSVGQGACTSSPDVFAPPPTESLPLRPVCMKWPLGLVDFWSPLFMQIHNDSHCFPGRGAQQGSP